VSSSILPTHSGSYSSVFLPNTCSCCLSIYGRKQKDNGQENRHRLKELSRHIKAAFHNISNESLVSAAILSFEQCRAEGLMHKGTEYQYESIINLIAAATPAECEPTLRRWNVDGPSTPLGECTYFALLSAMVNCGEVSRALALLEEEIIPRSHSVKTSTSTLAFPALHLKARLFLPLIFELCDRSDRSCEAGAEAWASGGQDATAAVRLWHLMRASIEAPVTEETYVRLVSTLARRLRRTNLTTRGAQPAPGKCDTECDTEARWLAAAVAEVLDCWMHQARFISVTAHTALLACGTGDGTGRSHFGSPWLNVCSVAVSNSGRCAETGRQLRLVGLSRCEARVVRSALLAKIPPRFLPEVGRFARFLRKRLTRPKSATEFATEACDGCPGEATRPFSVVVDAPNVAYHRQNKVPGGRFQFTQIERLVEALKQSGEEPLIVLPFK